MKAAPRAIADFAAFPTLMLETLNLAAARELDRAFLNVVGGLAFGIFALFVGLGAGAGVLDE